MRMRLRPESLGVAYSESIDRSPTFLAEGGWGAGPSINPEPPTYYNTDVESHVKRFSSHEDSKKAEREYYRRLTPAQRLEILLELIDRHRKATGASSDRIERVYRIVKLSSR